MGIENQDNRIDVDALLARQNDPDLIDEVKRFYAALQADSESDPDDKPTESPKKPDHYIDAISLLDAAQKYNKRK